MESDECLWEFGGEHIFSLPYSLRTPRLYDSTELAAYEFPSPGSSAAHGHSELLIHNGFHGPELMGPVSPLYQLGYAQNDASPWVPPVTGPVNQASGVCTGGLVLQSAEPPTVSSNHSGLSFANSSVTPRRGSACAGYPNVTPVAEFDTRRRKSAPSVRAQPDLPQMTTRNSPPRTRKWGKDDQEEIRRIAEKLENRNARLVTERERLSQEKSELMEQLFLHSSCDQRINEYLTYAAKVLYTP